MSKPRIRCIQGKLAETGEDITIYCASAFYDLNLSATFYRFTMDIKAAYNDALDYQFIQQILKAEGG